MSWITLQHPLFQKALASTSPGKNRTVTDGPLDFGRVRPGWTCSRVWRQRATLATIESTVAVQAARNSSMVATKSATPRKDPRRIRLFVSSANQRSFRFNQLQLVGT